MKPMLNRNPCADNVFLADLERAPKGLMRSGIPPSSLDERSVPNQQPGRLRSTKKLATAIDRHVCAAGEPPVGSAQIVRRGVDENGDASLARWTDYIFQTQLRLRLLVAIDADHRDRLPIQLHNELIQIGYFHD